MRHPLPLATLGRPKEVISPHTMHLPRSSGLVAELADMVKLVVGLAAGLGTVGPQNHNHSHSRKTREQTRSRGREIGSMDSLEEHRDSLTLSRDSGTEPAICPEVDQQTVGNEID